MLAIICLVALDVVWEPRVEAVVWVLPRRNDCPVCGFYCVHTPEQRAAIDKREAAYREAFERAERTGASVYYSDGEPGSKYPAGSYRLWYDRADACVRYQANPKILPKPDME